MKGGKIGFLGIILLIALGVSCSCAASTGEVVAWGYDYWHQVRDAPSGDDFIAVAGGHDCSVALKGSGQIVVWGGSEPRLIDDVPTESDFVKIAVGGFHALAIRRDGSLAAWGKDDDGQAQGQLPAGSDFVDISAGLHNSLALRDDGSLVGWGGNGHNVTDDVPSEADFKAIACGIYHSVALRYDGSLTAWGWNEYGQTNCPGGNDYVAVAAGAYHSVAMKSDGSVVCWGAGEPGAPGTLPHYGQSTPPEGEVFEKIAVSGSHNLGLRADGTIIGWGRDENERLDIPGDYRYLAVGAGHDHSLAVGKPVTCCPGPCGSSGYSGFVSLDFPESAYTLAMGIDGDTVVGMYHSGGRYHGFCCNVEGEDYISLDYPDSVWTSARGIDDARIVGTYYSGGLRHGYLYDMVSNVWSEYGEYDYPTVSSDDPIYPGYDGPYWTNVLGIDDDNIVGHITNTSGGNARGFLYNMTTETWTLLHFPGATHTEAQEIDGDVIVGFYYTGTPYHGFAYNISTKQWSEPGDYDFPGASLTSAEDVDGVNIVGKYTLDGNHGFVYDGTTWASLPDISGATKTYVHGIDGDKIVGYYYDGREHGFVYTRCLPSSLSDGLVAYYPFEGNADDASGNGNPGVEYGGPLYVGGICGEAIDLDEGRPVANYVDIGTFNFGQYESFTATAWFKTTGGAANDAILGYSAGGGSGAALVVALSHATPEHAWGHVSAEFLDDNAQGGAVMDWDGVNYKDNRWHAVSFVRDTGQSELRLYIDGALIDSTEDMSQTSANIEQLRIGCLYGNQVGEYWDPYTGLIDEVRIYERALSDCEIRKLACAPEDQGLVAYYPFEGNADDASGNGNHGVENGGPSYVGGVYGEAISLDGIDDQMVYVPYDESMNTSSGVTYAAWMRPEQVMVNANILGRWDNDNHELVQIDVGHGGKLHYWDWYFYLEMDPAPEPGSWAHVAVTVVPNSVASMYVDGVLIDRKAYPNSTVTNPTGWLEIGGSDPFAGAIDEVRIYNRALSGCEIGKLACAPENMAPEADADGPYVGYEGSLMTLDASGSSDPDGDALQYRWDLDDDGVWDTDWSSDPTAVHTWGDDYSGAVVVEVSDGELSDTATSAATISNVAPTVSIDAVIYEGEFILPGDSVEFEGSFQDPGVLDSHTIEWLSSDNPIGSELEITHSFGEAGQFVITLLVTDDDGGIGSDSVEVTVKTPEGAIDDVNDVVEEMDLPQGLENSLTAKLDAAISSLDEGDDNAAANQLQAFINQVEAKRGKDLSDEEADLLISLAEEIIAHIDE